MSNTAKTMYDHYQNPKSLAGDRPQSAKNPYRQVLQEEKQAFGESNEFDSSERKNVVIPKNRFREQFNEKTKAHYSYYDTEKLSEINLELKKTINVLKQDNLKLKSLLIKNKREFEMQNKEFDNIISTNIGKRKETLKYQPSIISNLKRELNAMKERYEQLEGANEDLRKNIKATKINELEADLQVYATECERLRKLVDEGLTNIPDVSNEQEKICAELEGKLRGKLTEITSLNNTVSTKNNEIKSLNEKIKILKAQNDEHTSNAKQETQKSKVAHDKELVAIKDQLEELKSQNSQLSKELNNHKTSNSEISNKEKELKTKILKYESESKFHKDEISKYKQQITQLQNNIKEITDKLPKEDLNSQLLEYQKKNKDLQEQLQLANKAVEQSKKVTEDSLSDLKLQLVSKTNEISALKAAIEKSKNDIKSEESGIPKEHTKHIKYLREQIVLKLQIANISKDHIPDYLRFSESVNIAEMALVLHGTPFALQQQDAEELSFHVIDSDKKPKKETILKSKEAVKKLSKFIGSYPIFDISEHQSLLTAIHKKYKSLSQDVITIIQSKDTNKDGIIGVEKLRKILDMHTSIKNDDISFIIYYCVKQQTDFTVIKYAYAFNIIEGKDTEVKPIEETILQPIKTTETQPLSQVKSDEPTIISKPNINLLPEDPIKETNQPTNDVQVHATDIKPVETQKVPEETVKAEELKKEDPINYDENFDEDDKLQNKDDIPQAHDIVASDPNNENNNIIEDKTDNLIESNPKEEQVLKQIVENDELHDDHNQHDPVIKTESNSKNNSPIMHEDGIPEEDKKHEDPKKEDSNISNEQVQENEPNYSGEDQFDEPPLTDQKTKKEEEPKVEEELQKEHSPEEDAADKKQTQDPIYVYFSRVRKKLKEKDLSIEQLFAEVITNEDDKQVVPTETFTEIMSKLECAYCSNEILLKLQLREGILLYDQIVFYGKIQRIIDYEKITEELRECIMQYIAWCGKSQLQPIEHMSDEFDILKMMSRGREKLYHVISVGNFYKHLSNAAIATKNINIDILLCEESPNYVLIWKLEKIVERVAAETEQQCAFEEITGKISAALEKNEDAITDLSNKAIERDNENFINSEELMSILLKYKVAEQNEIEFFMNALCQGNIESEISLDQFFNLLKQELEYSESPDKRQEIEYDSPDKKSEHKKLEHVEEENIKADDLYDDVDEDFNANEIADDN